MSEARSALYSPYGAYELKAKYQRNLFRSSIIVGVTIILGVVAAYILQAMTPKDLVIIPDSKPQTIITLDQVPPHVIPTPPRVQVQQPAAALPRVGIPIPVADDQVLDENVILANRREMADLHAADPLAIGAGDVTVDIGEEYNAGPNVFVPHEVEPSIIYQPALIYPKLAQTAGLEGDVIIQALVSERGEVLDVRVAKSSGVATLDEAAAEQAKEITYSPGLQNNRPVKLWVSYTVKFRLNN